MTLPFDGITVFLYSFYGLLALGYIAVKSVNMAVSEYKKGIESA